MGRAQESLGFAGVGLVVGAWLLGGSLLARAEEPPAINPFGPIKHEREDAIPGYLEMSDGRVAVGNVYLTRDRRIKIFDAQLQRQREIPLAKIQQIDCQVKREWMEKEWRFKELALDQKVYTGRTYPVREYIHTVTLTDGRKITGTIDECVVYVQPYTYSPREATGYRPHVDPEKFVLYQENKGEMGSDLKSLKYVKTIKLGKDALEEGRKKATARRPVASSAEVPAREARPK